MTDMDVLFEGGVDSAEEMPSSEAPASAEEVTTGENPYACEAEGVRAVYPHFDLAAEMEHPVLGKILRGEVAPTLKQLYEATHLDEIFEGGGTAAGRCRDRRGGGGASGA